VEGLRAFVGVPGYALRVPMLSRLADTVRGNSALRGLAHAAVRLIPDIPRTITIPDLGPVRIRMRRHRWMLWEEFARSDTITFGMFERLIHPGDIVYDIGANIGIYARVMQAWFGASRVIAIEPMRENFDLLTANIALAADPSQFTPLRMALSDVEGEEDLQIDDMTSGTAVLTSVSGGQPSAGRSEFGLPPLTEKVRIVTLDGLIEHAKLPPPQMMKIDTEGAEVKVLRGAMETLRRHRPRLCIALHGTDKAHDTFALLESIGYSVCGFVSSGGSGAPTYRQLHSDDAAKLANNNVIASSDLHEVEREIQPRTGRRAH
jgi:FkbM family methyltransferase